MQIWERITKVVDGLTHVSNQISEANRARDTQYHNILEALAKMKQEIADALARQETTILEATNKEFEELKVLVEGGNTAEIVQAIDDATARHQARIDELSTKLGPTSGPSGSGETGTGGSGEGPEA